MKEVLFVQGAGAGTHDEWDIHLVHSLERELGDGYAVRYPAMPGEADPQLAEWRAALEEELRRLPDGAIAVGHSVGGTVLLDLLASDVHVPALDAVILIAAPFVGKGGWELEEFDVRDLGARLPTTLPILLFHGDADESVPVGHLDRYAEVIPHARVHRLPGRDHQLDNDLSTVARAMRALGGVPPGTTR